VEESPTDAELVAAMARGEQAAIESLYDRHAGLMMGVAMRMLKERAAAEDLVHDVFLEAWRAANSFDRARGTVRTWLMVRLRSRALDRLRSARVTRQVDTGGERLPEPEDGPKMDTGGLDRERVRIAVAELPEPQRAVLELAYYRGLSSTEVAEVLGVPVGTVKSRTAAAFRKLRAALGEAA
jgi:RNA polymerase sigma-70 factor, ECF subfamily